ncbi:MAG: hypothetical protein HYZ58_12825 [Acidobacteria bacterium]|nr:hypothetical protein [Acidobacteriota bacterium]MBI3264016.1 hypothetical protein [Acidobacteriota bacterium]
MDDSTRRRLFDGVPTGTPALRGEHDCFADEIAIDFPSAAAVVDRMRAAFVDGDESAARLCTLVELSMREASDGITFPIDVPLHGTCPLCGGRGETWMEACRPCGGSGASLRHHRVRVSLPAGVSDGARFHFKITAPQTRPARLELRVAVRA